MMIDGIIYFESNQPMIGYFKHLCKHYAYFNLLLGYVIIPIFTVE